MEMSRPKFIRKRFKALRDEQQSHLPKWRDTVDVFSPQRGRYLSGEGHQQHNDGKKKYQKIINSRAALATRILVAGLQSGMTSPSRPWFALGLADEKLTNYKPVAQWLHDVRNILLTIFARSNFYNAMQFVYREIALFGTAPMFIEEDFDHVIRCRPLTIGEYVIGLDAAYRPTHLIRQFVLTADQMRETFGENNLPQRVKQTLERGQGNQIFDVLHSVTKNPKYTNYERGRKNLTSQAKKYESLYLPLNNADDEDQVLRQSWYNDIPFICPRWDTVANDPYGCEHPAEMALGDNKMLQKMEEKKLKALDKQIDPPLNAPASMREEGATIVAGGINYVDPTAGQVGMTPVYQVRPEFQGMALELDRVEQRLRECFFTDLFLAVINETKRMTATEVAQRYEEKMVILGPVLERLQNEALDTIVERTFDIAWNLGILPPPPPDLPAGMPIDIQYISTLAQAQKMIGISSIEQFTAYVANVAQVFPEARDKFDVDKAVDNYAKSLGIPPDMVRSDKQVADMRQQQAQATSMRNMAEQGPNVTKALKTLSETDLGDGKNALQPLLSFAQ